MRTLILVAAVFVAGCAAGRSKEATAADDRIADGRAVAEAQCARCHAVGPIGDSPRPGAPAFRTLFAHYDGVVLEEELIEGVKIGHPDMPDFQFEPGGASALVAYIASIQER